MSKIKIIGFTIIISSLMQIVNAQTKSTGDVTNIVTVDTLDNNSIYGRIWQPYIAKWNEETYAIAYGRQLKGKTDMGDYALYRNILQSIYLKKLFAELM